MKKVAKIMVGIIGIMCLHTVHVRAQKNIKEFNVAEEAIYKKLIDDSRAMGGIPFNLPHNDEWTDSRIKTEIDHRKNAIHACEKRLQACKNALGSLPDAPSLEVSSNAHLREHTQRTFINAWYPDLIRDFKNQLKQLEDGLSERARLKTAVPTAYSPIQNVGGSNSSTQFGIMSSEGSPRATLYGQLQSRLQKSMIFAVPHLSKEG